MATKTSKDYYEKSYLMLETAIDELKSLDKRLSETDKKYHLKIIELLEQQLQKINDIAEYAIMRKEDIINNYKDLWEGLEFRRKEADKKLKIFTNETKNKLDDLRKNNYNKEEINKIIKERNRTQKSHDEYIEKIKIVEGKIKRLKKDIEVSCKKSAYSAKRLSKKR